MLWQPVNITRLSVGPTEKLSKRESHIVDLVSHGKKNPCSARFASAPFLKRDDDLPQNVSADSIWRGHLHRQQTDMLVNSSCKRIISEISGFLDAAVTGFSV
mmetsp:Transcript_2118/g.3925  ORF Transcript_2118/g.3925 Transcript_2118/m.3925 type:complete len:102 (-) Transcript_2118:265-570(-)